VVGFIENGSKVILCSRDTKVCEQAAQELNKKYPGKCWVISANLSLEKECIRVAQEIAQKEDRLDVLVNNGKFNN
jgi:short-subunit dehydrogenase